MCNSYAIIADTTALTVASSNDVPITHRISLQGYLKNPFLQAISLLVPTGSLPYLFFLEGF